jgi:hypothetical protein
MRDARTIRQTLTVHTTLQGIGEFRSPHTPPDEAPTGFVWGGFSDEALLARTREVYTAAFAIYTAFVRFFFATFSPGLRLAQLLPVNMAGRLIPPSVDRFGPGLSYTMHPLPFGSASRIEIELSPTPLS